MRILIGFLLALILTSCGGGSGGSDSTTPTIGDPAQLQLYSPRFIPAMPINSSVYIVIQNSTNTLMTNLSYTLTDIVEDGSHASMSPNQCLNIEAGGVCSLQINLSPNASNGSFALSVSNANGNNKTYLGVEKILPNNLSGVNGVDLYYYDTVPSNLGYALVTGAVLSSSVVTFNTAQLTNKNQGVIANQYVVSPNLGNNLTALSQGATFGVLAKVPANPSVQQFGYDLSYVVNGVVNSDVLAPANYSVKITNNGVLNALSNNLYYTSQVLSHTATLYNIGHSPVTIKSITPADSSVQITGFTPNTVVGVGDVLNFAVKLTSNTLLSNSSVTVTYNDGSNDVPLLLNLLQENPTPPGPVPTPGVRFIFSPNNTFYVTTASESITNTLNLTNMGNSLESSFAFSLPSGFSLVGLTESNSCSLSNNTVTTVLSPNQSCNVGVRYNSTVVTPQSIATININYVYDTNQSANSSISALYRVEQSSANLVISPSGSVNFTPIVANNDARSSQDFVLTNNGEISADNLSNTILGNGFNINSGSATTCANSLLVGESCVLQVDFGPSNESGSKTASLINTYNAYPNQVESINTLLNGPVQAAGSAVFSGAILNTQGMLSGSGAVSDPFVLEQGTVATVTYQITNIGSVSASNFYLTQSAFASGISISGGSCSFNSAKPITLASGSSCTIQYTVNVTNPSKFSVNQNSLQLNWVDIANPRGATQYLNSQAYYFQVYQTPQINILVVPSLDLNNVLSLNAGQNFVVTANLIGGYNTNQAVTLSDNVALSYVNNPCTVTSAIPSCNINGMVLSNATVGDKLVTVNSGNILSSPNSFTIRVISDGLEEIWIGGSNLTNQSGVYGTILVPSVNNIPGGRSVSGTWIDNQGRFWLFGGKGVSATAENWLNDLWMYNQSTNEWTWMSGSNEINQPGHYGTLGVPDVNNIPGSRDSSIIWIDSTGNLWLFGGRGFDANGDRGVLNDLWMFNPVNLTWTWVGGSNIINQLGVYGTQGVASSLNQPGARGSSSHWIDSQGNFWLFGGIGFATVNSYQELNDVWKYDIANNVWIWVGGSQFGESAGNYGTRGVASTSNIPSARYGALSMVDSNGKFWLFGGTLDENACNDLWKYDPVTQEWTWMSGSNQTNQFGVYDTKGSYTLLNQPGSRALGVGLASGSDTIYIFGGAGYAASGDSGNLNDLWAYNILNNQWDWLAGDNTVDQSSVYGTKGSYSPTNQIGGRYGLMGFVNNDSGDMYIFGGNTDSSFEGRRYLNDLWQIKF